MTHVAARILRAVVATKPVDDGSAGWYREQDAAPLAVAALVAQTKEAKRALGYREDVHVSTFPFKVGRESRTTNPATPPAVEQRLGIAPQLNDIYLAEPPWADLLHISREHFLIDRTGDRFFLVDRGSVCGTIVAGQQVGGNRAGGRTEIQDGDLIIVGTSSSAYVYRFDIL
jgi:hypothetical protein